MTTHDNGQDAGFGTFGSVPSRNPLPPAPDATAETATTMETVERVAPALSNALGFLRKERGADDVEPGSTPLPESWALLRAVFGGASADDLKTLYSGDPCDDDTAEKCVGRVRAAQKRARLSAGLHVFTGHTGGGKTAVAINLARAAAKARHPVVYVALELDPEELAARLVALEAAEADPNGVGPSWADLTFQLPLSDAERRARDRALDTLKDRLGHVYVWAPDPTEATFAPTVANLRRMVYAVRQRHGATPLVVFDYLQAPGFAARNVEDERFRPLRERIAVIVMELRHLSKRHTLSDGTTWDGCPVVVLSTTARSNVTGQDAPAGMRGDDPDLIRGALLEQLKALPKEAGEIEATAVTSWAITTAEKGPGGVRAMTFRLAKNRKGPVGQWVPVRFWGATGRVSDDESRYSLAARTDKHEQLEDDQPGAKKSKKLGRA